MDLFFCRFGELATDIIGKSYKNLRKWDWKFSKLKNLPFCRGCALILWNSSMAMFLQLNVRLRKLVCWPHWPTLVGKKMNFDNYSIESTHYVFRLHGCVFGKNVQNVLNFNMLWKLISRKKYAQTSWKKPSKLEIPLTASRLFSIYSSSVLLADPIEM